MASLRAAGEAQAQCWLGGPCSCFIYMEAQPWRWGAPGNHGPGFLLRKSDCVELNSVLRVHVHLEIRSLHLLLRCGHPGEGKTLFQPAGDAIVGVADVGP